MTTREGESSRSRMKLPRVLWYLSETFFRNVLSGWAVLAVNVAYGLAVTPLVVRALNTEGYGVWSFLNGLVGYSELMYLGLGSAVIRQVAHHLALRDQPGVNRVLSVVLEIYVVLGLFCLLAFSVVGLFLGEFFALPATPEIAHTAALVCLLLGGRLFLAFVASAFSGVLAGHDRFDLVNGINLGAALLRILIIPFALRLPSPLLGLAAATTLLALIETIAMLFVANQANTLLKVRWALPTMPELRLLYGFGLQSFVILMSLRLISYTDTTVIGVVLGAGPVALYSLPQQLLEYGRSAVTTFSAVLLPGLVAMRSAGDASRLRLAFISSSRLGGAIGALVLSILMGLGDRFLGVWIGSAYGESAGMVLPVLCVASLCQLVAYQIPFAFYQALHAMRWPAAVLLTEACVNVALSVVLARRFGIVGVAVGTLIPALLVGGPILPNYLCRKLGIPVRAYASQVLFPIVLIFAGNWLLLGGLNAAFPRDTYLTLLLKACAAGSLGILIGVKFAESEQRHALGRWFASGRLTSAAQDATLALDSPYPITSTRAGNAPTEASTRHLLGRPPQPSFDREALPLAKD